LTGQYPSGAIDWGTNNWWVSGPWQGFTTNSVSFNGGGSTSKTFQLVKPLRLVQLDAYNGGTGGSTISVSCAGQPTAQVVVNARQLLTLATGWASTCSGTVTITSSNGWDTNFDNLILDQGP
jgi:hypothetical protein